MIGPLTGIWRGSAGEGGALDVRIHLLDSDRWGYNGVMFFGDRTAGPLVDVGEVRGALEGDLLTLETQQGTPVRIAAELSRDHSVDHLSGTIEFSDPEAEVPIELTRFSVPLGYRPVSPTRVYDSREDSWPLWADETRRVRAGGMADVPQDGSAAAVLVNLTMTDTDGPGFLTAWSADLDTRPGTSNVNVTRAGATASNMAIVSLDRYGWMNLYSLLGTHVIVDVFGWFPVGSDLHLVDPRRLMDTREGSRPGAGAEFTVQVAGANGIPSTGVAAAVLNVTATDSAAAGFVTAWPSGTPRGTTSTVNVSGPGQTIANHAIVPVGADGAVKFFVSHGTHVIVDVFGWFPTPTEFPAENDEILLRNGGFEAWGSIPDVGSFDTYEEIPVGAWFVTGGSVDLVGPSQGIAHQGRQFVDLNGNDSYVPGALQQLIPTNPGHRYRIGFWLAGNPRGPAVKELEVAFGAERRYFSFDTTGHTNEDLGWEYHEFDADPDCNTTTLLTFHSLTQGDAGPNLDAVTLRDLGPGSGCRPSGYRAVTPTRILDTRPGERIGYSGGKPAGGDTVVTVQVTGTAGLPPSGVAAVVVNLTATETDGPNFVAAYPSGQDRPATSNVNLEFPGETRANSAVVPVGADGRIALVTHGPVHLIVDVLGYFG